MAYYYRDPESHNVRRNARMVLYRARNRAVVDAFLAEHPCVDCGIGEIVVLEFDHIRGKKIDDVSSLVREGAGLENVQTEIAKCVVRCANCHRRKTAQDIWPEMRKRKRPAEAEISLLPAARWL